MKLVFGILLIIVLNVSCTNNPPNFNNKKVAEEAINLVFPDSLFYNNEKFLIEKYGSFDTKLMWQSNVFLVKRQDTIYLNYIIANETFINAGSLEPNEFAGFFRIKDLVHNTINLRIINYRYTSDIDDDFKYAKVQLTFTEQFDTLFWKLMTNAPYLLTEDTLILEMNED